MPVVKTKNTLWVVCPRALPSFLQLHQPRYNILHSFIRKSMTEMPSSEEVIGKIRLSFTKGDQHIQPRFWLIIPNYPIGKY